MSPNAGLTSTMNKEEILIDRYVSWSLSLKKIAANSQDEASKERYTHLSKAALEKAQLLLK